LLDLAQETSTLADVASAAGAAIATLVMMLVL
jgi:hypothetical protein